MLAASVAELFQFQPVGCRLTVLGRRIIPLFAITALHGNDFSGHTKQLLACSFSLHQKKLIPDRFSGEEPAFLCGAGAVARVSAVPTGL